MTRSGVMPQSPSPGRVLTPTPDANIPKAGSTVTPPGPVPPSDQNAGTLTRSRREPSTAAGCK
jgi:hypothetical protein